MTGKIDKFTAARIRRFAATGMAVQKALPFERLRFGSRPPMTMTIAPDRRATPGAASRQQQAS